MSALMLSGCPGTLDVNEFSMTGSGGNTATGGTGGGNPTGGATGTGGTASSNCTGGNDGATIVTMTCATQGCHDPTGAPFSGSLDLTVNSSIGSRLVGVMASQPTGTNMAACTSQTEPYLAATNPVTGLLIDKIKPTYPCGSRMPYAGLPLSTTQQNCLIQWATTLTSP